METAPGLNPDPVPPQQPPVQDGKSRWVIIHFWIRDILISIFVSFFVILFVYQPVRVDGGSMEPGLEDQERIFINKLVYRFGGIEHGDIIVFHYPRDVRKSFIKRVIGLPGDHIRIYHGRVYRNGLLLQEPYVPEEYADEYSSPETVVPARSYFVLGDHRSMSKDSRDFGSVQREYIYGKAVFGYWPMDRLGVLH